jgi:hypothetical protein
LGARGLCYDDLISFIGHDEEVAESIRDDTSERGSVISQMISQGPEPPLDLTIQQELLSSGPYRKSLPLPPVTQTTRPQIRHAPPLPPKPSPLRSLSNGPQNVNRSQNSLPFAFLLSVETAIVGGDGSMQLTGNMNELQLKFDTAVTPFPTNLTKGNKQLGGLDISARRVYVPHLRS